MVRLCSFMRSWVTNMNRDLIPCAMGTTKYSIVKEQVAMQVVLQLLLSFSFGGRKSLKVSL